MVRVRNTAWAAFALLALAFWPVVQWWVVRTTDTSDEALGLAALVLLGVVTVADRSDRRAVGLGWPELAIVAVYAATFAWAPNLVRGIFAAAAIGVVVGRVRGTGPFHLGTWGVVAMTLPLLASLRFFLGYPLRWITTQMTAVLLRLGGLMVEPEGLALVMGPTEVWVDAPCSGVQMLWVGVFLAVALAFVFRLRNSATMALFAVALVATIAGNISRASGVFYLEAGLIDAPPIAHDLIGIAAFCVVASGVAASGFWMRQFAIEPRERAGASNPWATAAIVIAAAAVPLIMPPTTASVDATFPGWPTELDGQPLQPRELSERDKPYLAGFPGRIAAFRTGDEEVLVRWVARPTRRLHSAADCYRGLGYEVTPMTSSDGWSRFEVARDDTRLIVRERIVDGEGETFGDVGAWYWAAKLGSSTGPWWNVVRTRVTSAAP